MPRDFASTRPRRSGRKVSDEPLVHVNLNVEASLWQWALDQPRGAGQLIRRLLASEKARQEQEQADTAV